MRQRTASIAAPRSRPGGANGAAVREAALRAPGSAVPRASVQRSPDSGNPIGLEVSDSPTSGVGALIGHDATDALSAGAGGWLRPDARAPPCRGVGDRLGPNATAPPPPGVGARLGHEATAPPSTGEGGWLESDAAERPMPAVGAKACPDSPASESSARSAQHSPPLTSWLSPEESYDIRRPQQPPFLPLPARALPSYCAPVLGPGREIATNGVGMWCEEERS